MQYINALLLQGGPDRLSDRWAKPPSEFTTGLLIAPSSIHPSLLLPLRQSDWPQRERGTVKVGRIDSSRRHMHMMSMSKNCLSSLTVSSWQCFIAANIGFFFWYPTLQWEHQMHMPLFVWVWYLLGVVWGVHTTRRRHLSRISSPTDPFLPLPSFLSSPFVFCILGHPGTDCTVLHLSFWTYIPTPPP